MIENIKKLINFYSIDGNFEKFAKEIYVFHGEGWRAKIKPNKIKGIKHNKAIQVEYERLVLRYIEDFMKDGFKKISDLIDKSRIKLDSKFDENIENGTIFENKIIKNAIKTEVKTISNKSKGFLASLSVKIKQIGKKINDENSTEFSKQMREAIGFVPDFGKVYPRLEKWVNENVKLIKNVNNEMKDLIKSEIIDNFKTGKRASELKEKLSEITDFEQRRLRLIARDQTMKLYGQITKGQHLSLGLDEYIWRGVGDERERDSHIERNDKKCKYGTGIEPGQEFQCRCYAEVVLSRERIEGVIG